MEDFAFSLGRSARRYLHQSGVLSQGEKLLANRSFQRNSDPPYPASEEPTDLVSRGQHVSALWKLE